MKFLCRFRHDLGNVDLDKALVGARIETTYLGQAGINPALTRRLYIKTYQMTCKRCGLTREVDQVDKREDEWI